MSSAMVTVEVNDPHEITRRMWDLFAPTPTSAITPRQFLARSYAAGDWRHFQQAPDAYRTTTSVAKLGPLCFTHIADREPTDLIIRAPGIENHYCLTLLRQGEGQLRRPNRPTDDGLMAGSVALFRVRAGTVLRTGRDARKVNVWIPATLVDRQVALLLEEPEPERLDLDASLAPASSGPAASLRRLTEGLLAELADPHSLLARGIGAPAAVELLLQSAVMTVVELAGASPRAEVPAAAPGSVRRAEEFMQAHAEEALTVEAIAQAAGCSVRALQLAFRRFRGTTPIKALQRARLVAAYRAIAGAEDPPLVADVAARFGFANPGRFANLYRQAFGEFPSESRRNGANRGDRTQDGTPTK